MPVHPHLQTPVQLSAVVAVPGTAVPIAAAALYVRSAEFYAGRDAAANVGNIFVGDATVDQAAVKTMEVAPGATVEFPAGPGIMYDLHEYYIDALNAGDGLRGTYVARAV